MTTVKEDKTSTSVSIERSGEAHAGSRELFLPWSIVQTSVKPAWCIYDSRGAMVFGPVTWFEQSELVVRAVNAHYQMRDALARLLREYEDELLVSPCEDSVVLARFALSLAEVQSAEREPALLAVESAVKNTLG